MAHRAKLQGNFDVDYVIIYRFTDTSEILVTWFGGLLLILLLLQDKSEAQKGLEYLLEALARVGLAIEVRNGDKCSLLVFVKVASDERLNHEVYLSRSVGVLLT